MQRTHYNVEVEHWLVKLLEGTNNDLPLLLKASGADPARVLRDLQKSLDHFEDRQLAAAGPNSSVIDVARDAWLVASLEFNTGRTRSGHLLLALLNDRGGSAAPCAKRRRTWRSCPWSSCARTSPGSSRPRPSRPRALLLRRRAVPRGHARAGLGAAAPWTSSPST